MKFRHVLVLSFLTGTLWLVGCGLQTQPSATSVPPALANTSVPETAPTSDTTTPAATNSVVDSSAADPPRVVTLDDNEHTISVTLGDRFALQLGQSPGSPWYIRVTNPEILDPPIRQLDASGSRILFHPLKPGEAKIDANSHAFCVRPGPCPDVFVYFSLNVRVLTQ